MLARYCPACGCPLDALPAAAERLALVCPECTRRVVVRTGAAVSALLTRGAGAAQEVLLVRRRPDARLGAGLYCLPGRVVEVGEEARDAVARAVLEQAGLRVEVEAAYEVHSNLHDPEEPTVGSWFRVRPASPGGVEAPRAGGEVDEAAYFPLAQLPSLSFSTDRLVLERLAHDAAEGGAPEATASDAERLRSSDLTARLARRREKYRDLLEAYTNELMRGAWINDLHLRLSRQTSPQAVAAVAADHLAGRREVDRVLVWFLGPPDRCDRCPWADRCPRDRCLHLVAAATQEDPDAPERSAGRRDPAEQRVPLLRGVPVAEVALDDAAKHAELPGAGALPTRFEGFPLDTGEDVPGVLGMESATPIDANARRLFEVVARHVATLVRNARLLEDLQAANNVKRSFIARLSHELKTPLTAILGFAELLRDELQAAGNLLGADGAGTIEASGRKLLDMVESILEIAKLESGAGQFVFERADLVDAARDRVAARGEQARQKGLSLRLEGADEPRVVWADPRRVRQVLDQLLDNALKFTSAGGITVALSSSEDEVTCEVRDTGIGIGPEHLRSVFEPFHQVSEQVHIEYGGLGIGLATAKVLVEQQGGRIWVESLPGQGSRFVFALPRSAKRARGTDRLTRPREVAPSA